MRGVRGILAGSLTLITLHTLVAYKGPSKRLGELSGLAVGIVDKFMNPDTPGIPDRGARSTSSSSTSSSSSSTPAQAQAGREAQADRLGGGRYPAPVGARVVSSPAGGVAGRQNT